MGTSGTTPSNNSYGLDLNNGGWAFIAVLICIIFVLIVITLIIYFKSNKKINELKKLLTIEITADEYNLLVKYRKLHSRDKATINNTLLCLNTKPTDDLNKEE
ncbi:MAG: hypothetical protein NC131_00355 [Roseburia sp.]|nr:hypothetical protein [Roseburia sp.]